MERLVQARHALVGAVHRQAVLNEIVRADGEEIDLARQQIGSVCRRRNLDHHADRHLRHDFAPAHELRARVGDHLPRLAHLLDARHERKHDPELPVTRGPQQRAQLHLE